MVGDGGFGGRAECRGMMMFAELSSVLLKVVGSGMMVCFMDLGTETLACLVIDIGSRMDRQCY